MRERPTQPVFLDDRGALRFEENKIVVFLLDRGGYDMNKLAAMEFSAEDREQFAQLIGYTLGGFDELSYVREETSRRAWASADALLRDDLLRRLAEVAREAADIVGDVSGESYSANNRVRLAERIRRLTAEVRGRTGR